MQPIAGQLFGAGRESEIGEETAASVLARGGADGRRFCGLLLYPEPLLSLAKAPPAPHDRTVDYLRILSFGPPASLAFRVYSSLANAVGKPRLVMFLQVGGLVLKFPLNTWFIFGGPGYVLASTLQLGIGDRGHHSHAEGRFLQAVRHLLALLLAERGGGVNWRCSSSAFRWACPI